MWFKRKSKNRRLNRGHVLDVKVRSDQARAKRTRWAMVALGVTGCTLLCLYLFWQVGEWALDKFVYENSTFALRNIEVRTDGVIDPLELRRWANVVPGQNLIALDLASVKRNLELVSMIGSVSVERVLPRTLKIRVSERVPVAQVDLPTVGANGSIAVVVFELDANGVVIKPLDPRQCVVPVSRMSVRLPALTGLQVGELKPGRRLDSPQIRAALALISAFERSPMVGVVELRRLDVASPGVVVATTGQGAEITFALAGLEQQLARWRKIYDWGQAMNRAVASADLAVSNNVPVRWTTAGGAPAAAPKPSNPIRTRRNNV